MSNKLFQLMEQYLTICPFLTHPSIPPSSLEGQIEYSTAKSLRSSPEYNIQWHNNKDTEI